MVRSRPANCCFPCLHFGRPKTDHSSAIPLDHLAAGEKIWKYMCMHNDVTRKSDVILVLGNPDLRTAAHAAKLFLSGMSDWLLFSGNVGALTEGKWIKSEAEVFKDVAMNMGVPENKILLETEATNTGENIRYSHLVLHSMDIKPKSVILVQMPYMERRTYATFMKQWPKDEEFAQMQIFTSSPRIPLIEYPDGNVGSLADVISNMVGCLQRIMIYPDKQFQIHQEIPDDVLRAYHTLLSSGEYNQYLA